MHRSSRYHRQQNPPHSRISYARSKAVPQGFDTQSKLANAGRLGLSSELLQFLQADPVVPLTKSAVHTNVKIVKLFMSDQLAFCALLKTECGNKGAEIRVPPGSPLLFCAGSDTLVLRLRD